MKKIYKIGNENIEIGAHAPKIIGFNSDTGTPIFEGQIIEEKGKVFSYIHTTPKDRIIAILINILLSLIISLLIFIPRLSDFDITIFLPVLFLILYTMFFINIGMLITGLHIIDSNEKKLPSHIQIYKEKYKSLSNILFYRVIHNPLMTRYTCALLTFIIPFGPIISLICLFKTEKHQMLHDIFLQQYVVKKIK